MRQSRFYERCSPYRHAAHCCTLPWSAGAYMRRRDFIAGLGGAAVVGPRGAWAQQAGKLPTIGYLGASTRLILNQRREAFVQGLRELGWVEGRNVIIEYRWAEGRDERYAEIAAEFVRLKVDVIVVSATAPVMAAKRATSVIPIVFAISADPVGTGLVASLSRPGGNVTGLSIQTTDIARKRLEFLREVVPKFGRLAILTDVSSGGSVLDKEEARAAAATLGLDVIALDIRRAEDITPVFETLKGGADALYVCAGPRTFGNVTRINTLALGA